MWLWRSGCHPPSVTGSAAVGSRRAWLCPQQPKPGEQLLAVWRFPVWRFHQRKKMAHKVVLSTKWSIFVLFIADVMLQAGQPQCKCWFVCKHTTKSLQQNWFCCHQKKFIDYGSSFLDSILTLHPHQILYILWDFSPLHIPHQKKTTISRKSRSFSRCSFQTQNPIPHQERLQMENSDQPKLGGTQFTLVDYFESCRWKLQFKCLIL